MKLGDYVESKKAELLKGGYRQVELKRAEECKIGKHCTSIMLFTAKQIPLDAEVEEVDRSTLPDGYGDNSTVPGVQVTFEVVKPRCRKETWEYFYIKAV